MWKLTFTWKGVTRVYHFENLTKQYKLYGYHWVEDYINEVLYEVLENDLGILDDINSDNNEYLNYTIHDENGKSFDDYEC
jgi:hypothetical protein